MKLSKIFFYCLMGVLLMKSNYVYALEKMESDELSLTDNYVYDVAVDKRSNKWFGTRRGLSMLSGDKWTNFVRSADFAVDDIYALDTDNHDNVWIGTDDAIYMYDGNRFTQYGANVGVDFGRILTLKFIEGQGLWIGSEKGIYLFADLQKWVDLSDKFGQGLSNIFAIERYSTDGIIFGGSKLRTYVDGEFGEIGLPYFKGMYITAIKRNNGVYWIGTNRGLIKLVNGASKIYTHVNGMAGDNVTSIAIGQDNRVWVGTTMGVSSFDGLKFTKYNEESNFPEEFIQDIAIDNNNSIWVTTTNGAFKIRNNQISSFKKSSVFRDLYKVSWVEQFVKPLKLLGFISGYSDSTFRPLANITRAEVLKLVMNASKIDVDDVDLTKNKFNDVDYAFWAMPYILYATEHDMMGPKTDKLFMPNRNASRAEAVVALVKAFDIDTTKYHEGGFTDVSKEDFASIEAAKELGVVSGFGDNIFKPDAPITRAEFAKILYKTYQLKK